LIGGSLGVNDDTDQNGRDKFLECYRPQERDAESIKLEQKPVDFSDKYALKLLIPFVTVVIALMLVYMFL